MIQSSRRSYCRAGSNSFPRPHNKFSLHSISFATELAYQREQRNGGKAECYIGRCKETRFHIFSVQHGGLALKQGERFAHSFNVKHIKCYIEAALENRKLWQHIPSMHKQHINNSRIQKRNRRKSTEELKRGSGLKTTSQRKSQQWRRFGYPVLISIDFYDFTSPFTPWVLFRLRRYIKHSRQCFIGYPNNSNFVKNTPLRVVFSTLFSLFGYPDETLSLVFDILLENPLGNVVPQCLTLVYPPSLAVSGGCIKLRMLPRRYLVFFLGRELSHQCCKKQNHHQS